MDVIQATCRVILRDGVGGASMKAIAKELGTTVGVITHHFDTKSELVQLALQHVVGDLFEKAVANTADLPGPQRLERMLEEALPTTAARQRHWRVWVSFLGEIMGSEDLLEGERRQTLRFLAAIQDVLEQLRSEGSLSADVDPKREARAAMSLVDGLGVDAVLSPNLYPPAFQREVVQRYCRQLGMDSK